jgi:hypothetical protein
LRRPPVPAIVVPPGRDTNANGYAIRCFARLNHLPTSTSLIPFSCCMRRRGTGDLLGRTRSHHCESSICDRSRPLVYVAHAAHSGCALHAAGRRHAARTMGSVRASDASNRPSAGCNHGHALTLDRHPAGGCSVDSDRRAPACDTEDKLEAGQMAPVTDPELHE